MNRKEEKEIGGGEYSGIGGKSKCGKNPLKTGESPRECMIREAEEEIGIKKEDINAKEVGQAFVIDFSGEVYDNNWELHYFNINIEDFPETYKHREGKLEWISEDKIKELDLATEQGELINRILDGKEFIAEFFYVGHDNYTKKIYDGMNNLDIWSNFRKPREEEEIPNFETYSDFANSIKG